MALNQSVLVFRQLTLLTQISKLRQHFKAILGTTVTFAKPCSQPMHQPASDADRHHNSNHRRRCQNVLISGQQFPVYRHSQNHESPRSPFGPTSPIVLTSLGSHYSLRIHAEQAATRLARNVICRSFFAEYGFFNRKPEFNLRRFQNDLHAGTVPFDARILPTAGHQHP
jgi:hypothetical protein